MKYLLIIFLGLAPFIGKSQFDLHDYFEDHSVVHENTVWGNGASFVDFNLDGLDDITTADGNQLIRAFISIGDTFEEVDLGIDLAVNAHIKSVLWVDYDNDADYDLFISQSGGRIFMFEQVESMVFTDVSEQIGFPITSYNYQGAAFADVDHDGDLDFYVAKYYTPNLNPGAEFASQFFINNGDKTFTDVTTIRGVYIAPRAVFQPVFVDVNRDGHLDLYIIIDRAQWSNELFINDGSGFFSAAPANSGYNAGVDSMSATVGDYNNDGDPDFFLSDSYSGNVLLDNNGSGFFTNLASNLGVATYGFCWGANWIDANNDGLLDLSVATTTSTNGIAQNIFYKQNLDGTFSNLSSEWGLGEDVRPTYCNIIGDFNNDGYSDYYHNNNAPYPSNLWKNDGGNSSWISVTLEGAVDNTAAIGAEIQVFVNGQVQTRYVLCGESYLGQNSNRKIFGLGQSEIVDSLVVTWPNGTYDRYFNFLAQGNIHITQGDSQSSVSTYSLISFDSTLCPGQTVEVMVSQDALSTIWNTGSVEASLSINEPGIYYAIVTTNSGLVFPTDTLTIAWQIPPTLETFSINPSCSGNADGEIFLTTEYEENLVFQMGETQNTNGVFNSLSAGVYDVVVISQNGCMSQTQVTLTEPTAISASITPVHELCSEDGVGSVIISNLSGGAGSYTLIFSGENQNELPTGPNQLIIFDQNGCFVQYDFFIEEATPIELSTTVTPAIDDTPGSILVSASGGTGALSLFINGESMLLNETFTAAPGDYLIEVIDENDCVFSESITVEQFIGVNERIEEWTIYPNPVDNQFSLRLQSIPENKALLIYNAMGEVVEIVAISNLNMTISTTNWVPGTYYVKLGTSVSAVIKL